MHEDELFLRTLSDLAGKMTSADKYEWLRSSLLVRQLLIDGGTLVDQVNRRHGLKLTFAVPDASGLVDEHVLVYVASDDLGACPTRSVNRDGFFSTRLIYVNRQWFTVRDIVTTVANVLGGVHKGKPKDSDQELLSELNAALQVMGAGAAVQQMRRIGRIALQGLTPLAEAVVRGLPNPGHWDGLMASLRRI
jgi:hypothetical protein